MPSGARVSRAFRPTGIRSCNRGEILRTQFLSMLAFPYLWAAVASLDDLPLARLQIIFVPLLSTSESAFVPTKTSRQHDRFVMTRASTANYSRTVMSELRHANAFLIQFRGSPQTRGSELPGRVEHVASGNTAIFQSIDQLPQVLIAMFRSLALDEVNQDKPE